MPYSDIKEFEIKKGTTLSVLQDKKHKTNYINLYFSLPLTRENATKMSIISKVLKRGSKSFPTMAHLNSALDMNYSTSLSFSASKQGEREVFQVGVSAMKNSFAPNGEDVLKTALDIAFDSLLNPLEKDGGFLPEYFESEKKNLRDSILSGINNKALYAKKRFIKAMCEGEAFEINEEGDIDLLDTLDRKELLTFFKNLLKTARLDVYFVGDEKEERVVSLFATLFEKLERVAVSQEIATARKAPLEEKNVEEHLDINQGHLFIGFRCPVSYSHPDYLKFALFNMVMGGDVSSKMFMNLREKMSLCYTCYSSLDSVKGLFVAYAGIDFENKEKTLDAFFKELDDVKSGNISDTELEDAKRSFVNRMREIEDSPSLLAPWFYLRKEGGKNPRDPSDDAKKIMDVTVDDVVEASKAITLDTIYFLSK